MKTQTVIHMVGLSLPEAAKYCLKAAEELGIESRNTANFNIFSKVYLQRRSIGGCEALLYVAQLPGDMPNGRITMGYGVIMGLLVDTPINRSVIQTTSILYNNHFPTLEEASTAFNVLMLQAQREEEKKVNPVKPIVNRSNYNPVAGVMEVAQEVYTATVVLGSAIFEARQNALSFCPTETLGGVIQDIDALHKKVYATQRSANRLLEKKWNEPVK